MKDMIPNRKEKGFTLIELVMVIVILGILAAFALPRFADLGGDARRASIEGARGAVKSASGIVRSQVLAKGQAGAAKTILEGTDIGLINGYATSNPVNGNIAVAAQLSAEDFGLGFNNGELTVTLGNCSFTYTNATNEVPPVISPVTPAPADGDC